MSVKINDQAPDFTLPNTQNEPVSLASYKGKPVVLLFFPLAFSSVCTDELCSMRDELADYSSVGAEVLGISVDSPFALGQFKEKEKLNFPLLSDFNKEASKAYEAYYETFHGLNGVSKRSAFVVGADGKIAYAEVLEDAGKQPNFSAIKETVKSAA